MGREQKVIQRDTHAKERTQNGQKGSQRDTESTQECENYIEKYAANSDGDLADALASFHIACDCLVIHGVLSVSFLILLLSSFINNKFEPFLICCKQQLDVASFLCPQLPCLCPI